MVGSILGGLLLAVQTAILYQQTGLMRQQSGAAMLAESTQLRERLSIHYKLTLWNTEIHRAVTLGFGTGCSDQCKQLPLFEVLDGKAQRQEAAVQFMMSLASYIRVIVAPVTKLDAQTWDLRKAAIEPFPNFEDKYLEPVATVCLADVEHLQGFRQATQGLMIQSAALDLAIAGGEGAKDRWSAIIDAGRNMESLGQKLGVAGGVPPVESVRYTFGHLVSDVHYNRSIYKAAWERLKASCELAQKRDQGRLQELESLKRG